MTRSRLVAYTLSAGLLAALLAGCSDSSSAPDQGPDTPAAASDSIDDADTADSFPAAELDVPADVVGLVTSGLEISPAGEVLEDVRVERVIDGDTFKAVVDGELVSVRIIGFDTPETVKPGSPIECFGPESSEFATAVLSGQDVTLEFDETQGRYDRYGRVLAHVWVPTGAGGQVLFGAEVVAQGFGEERQYGDQPTTWTGVMRDLEQEARDSKTGLWGSC